MYSFPNKYIFARIAFVLNLHTCIDCVSKFSKFKQELQFCEVCYHKAPKINNFNNAKIFLILIVPVNTSSFIIDKVIKFKRKPGLHKTLKMLHVLPL
jgi:hypothetical protein